MRAIFSRREASRRSHRYQCSNLTLLKISWWILQPTRPRSDVATFTPGTNEQKGVAAFNPGAEGAVAPPQVKKFHPRDIISSVRTRVSPMPLLGGWEGRPVEGRYRGGRSRTYGSKIAAIRFSAEWRDVIRSHSPSAASTPTYCHVRELNE